jgi:hypothetical protein
LLAPNSYFSSPYLLLPSLTYPFGILPPKLLPLFLFPF